MFEKPVERNYFNKFDSNISYTIDAYGLHRYFKTCGSELNAKEAMALAGEKGYNPVLISKQILKGSCCSASSPTSEEIKLSSIKNIFFDFDKSNLRLASKRQLNDLFSILKSNPGYTSKLRAHTDAKGSLSYNEALSNRRAKVALQYLVSRGIPTSHVLTETFGENEPIAKNALNNGADTEIGRQFNRRVEIVILDSYGNILNDMVERIKVPNELAKL